MLTEPVHCLVVSPRAALGRDARSIGLLHDARALGLSRLNALECHDLYFVVGALNIAERERLARELLSDPLTQTTAWRENGSAPREPDAFVLEVALRPGVTDPVAEQITRAALVLGL